MKKYKIPKRNKDDSDSTKSDGDSPEVRKKGKGKKQM